MGRRRSNGTKNDTKHQQLQYFRSKKILFMTAAAATTANVPWHSNEKSQKD